MKIDVKSVSRPTAVQCVACCLEKPRNMYILLQDDRRICHSCLIRLVDDLDRHRCELGIYV